MARQRTVAVAVAAVAGVAVWWFLRQRKQRKQSGLAKDTKASGATAARAAVSASRSLPPVGKVSGAAPTQQEVVQYDECSFRGKDVPTVDERRASQFDQPSFSPEKVNGEPAFDNAANTVLESPQKASDQVEFDEVAFDDDITTGSTKPSQPENQVYDDFSFQGQQELPEIDERRASLFDQPSFSPEKFDNTQHPGASLDADDSQHLEHEDVKFEDGPDGSASAAPPSQGQLDLARHRASVLANALEKSFGDDDASAPQDFLHIAIADYQPQTGEELELLEGDRVTIESRFDNGWCIGRNERNGKHGLVPGSYVEPVAQDDGAVVWLMNGDAFVAGDGLGATPANRGGEEEGGPGSGGAGGFDDEDDEDEVLLVLPERREPSGPEAEAPTVTATAVTAEAPAATGPDAAITTLEDFDACDTNKDGMLTEAEVSAFVEKSMRAAETAYQSSSTDQGNDQGNGKGGAGAPVASLPSEAEAETFDCMYPAKAGGSIAETLKQQQQPQEQVPSFEQNALAAASRLVVDDTDSDEEEAMAMAFFRARDLGAPKSAFEWDESDQAQLDAIPIADLLAARRALLGNAEAAAPAPALADDATKPAPAADAKTPAPAGDTKTPAPTANEPAEAAATADTTTTTAGSAKDAPAASAAETIEAARQTAQKKKRNKRKRNKKKGKNN